MIARTLSDGRNRWNLVVEARKRRRAPRARMVAPVQQHTRDAGKPV